MGVKYFSKNKDSIKKDLLKYGAIWFRGFELMKSVKGYREMYEALEIEPCLDPLHSSGLRKFASERDALYEEVSIHWMRYKRARTSCIMNRAHIFGFLCFFSTKGQQTIFARSLYWTAL